MEMINGGLIKVEESKKLEGARKRLRENYEKAEEAKRQRRLIVIEPSRTPLKPLKLKVTISLSSLDPASFALKLQAARSRLGQSYQAIAANKMSRTVKILAPNQVLKLATRTARCC